MDLNGLRQQLGYPITISTVKRYSDSTKAVECVQGILKEIKQNSIVIEQYFSVFDYSAEISAGKNREFTNDEFAVIN